MILRVLFIISLLCISIMANPYEDLDKNIKLNVMVNYFLNEAIQKQLPPKPIKEELQDDGAILDPIKYEQYFNYIQRLKAIRESRIDEQKKIDEKYAGQIAFYNSKIKNLEKFYKKSENLNPLLQNSINKAFKVVYGKPKLKEPKYNETTGEFEVLLYAQKIYNVDIFTPKKVLFKISKGDLDSFFDEYSDAFVNVVFGYDKNLLIYDGIIIRYKSKDYKGVFVDEVNNKIKLNIKINDDIFRLKKL